MIQKMHLTGVEPAHMPPEGTALSIELQMHRSKYIHISAILQVFFSKDFKKIILSLLSHTCFQPTGYIFPAFIIYQYHSFIRF